MKSWVICTMFCLFPVCFYQKQTQCIHDPTKSRVSQLLWKPTGSKSKSRKWSLRSKVKLWRRRRLRLESLPRYTCSAIPPYRVHNARDSECKNRVHVKVCLYGCVCVCMCLLMLVRVCWCVCVLVRVRWCVCLGVFVRVHLRLRVFATCESFP